ncbi:CPXCG motif-containing cysteine-rich protein [Amphritea sp. HPY]|uniref:CPXCG motif-containing cysteine-rich protein n=1 Tax=Amphritea sp. HPY TaxID=3421652 RepID=UPI003D7CE9DD
MPIHCPYCGEAIEIEVDCSAGDQEYIEDCQVCCCPIQLSVILGGELPQIIVRHENEA